MGVIYLIGAKVNILGQGQSRKRKQVEEAGARRQHDQDVAAH
jgi:hypothetical protein